ncbi:hypothetical protein FHS83_002658 [Rhizomicrobium palustre]|uniref:Lipoprotein n=1 Tax=Rhizomicrobium palustre TaxID=189966 RepID=A0A846N2L9_9PROT|nr:hypothetical protein [Rhizomicrobium palustre]NIK89340.1 hypothetical protein [Rhizomicrobium palustre]
MRVLISALLLAAAPASAAAPVWISSCTGQMSVQYIQTIGADGFLHFGNGNGTFTSYKLKQVYYDGKIVCGGTTTKPGPKEIGGICADKEGQKIRIIYGVQIAAGIKPERVATYCDAQVTETAQ